MPKRKYVTDWSQVPVVVDVAYVSVLLGLHPRTVEIYLKKGKLNLLLKKEKNLLKKEYMNFK